jgi:methyl-accepting chemotaxis protein
MFANLSTRQRMSLVFILLAGGQAAAAAGLFMGWSPAWAMGLSAASSVLAVTMLSTGGAVLRNFLSSFSAHARRIADGDLSQDVPVQGSSDASEVLRSLQHLQESLRRTLGAIRGGADGVSVAAEEIATGNADLSNRTEQTASNLQQAASSMAQLTGTVNQTAESARTANQLASSASEVAARGGQVVAQVVSTMDEINTSSKKIADIIGTIDGIAFQTNILALNAAVEAARAGEQGRGFAVVASEVRSLAQRSAEAAREIKTLIGASVDKVESGSRLVQDAGNTMGEIVASVQRVTDIIGEISAAAAEQSSGIGQINSAVTQLDQMTQQNAALVEESAAAAESLKEQSRQLATAVNTFRIGTEAPKSPVHVAPKAVAASAIQHARKAAAPAKAAPRAAARPAPAPKASPAPAPAEPRPAAAASGGDDDWETF